MLKVTGRSRTARQRLEGAEIADAFWFSLDYRQREHSIRWRESFSPSQKSSSTLSEREDEDPEEQEEKNLVWGITHRINIRLPFRGDFWEDSVAVINTIHPLNA